MEQLDSATLSQHIFVKIVADANLPMDAPGFENAVIKLAVKSMKLADIYTQARGPYLDETRPKR